MSLLTQSAFSLIEQGLVPDWVIRRGIKSLIRKRLNEISLSNSNELSSHKMTFLENMSRSRIACESDKANEQHYTVPTAFYKEVLGPNLKYSSALWPPGVESLSEAEKSGLAETVKNADLDDGQTILELGCGWGSLTLWMASHFPNSQITAVSNSSSQKSYIEERVAHLGFSNVKVMTQDMNDFNLAPEQFDRVVSVEMFEHMRNWQKLFQKVYQWLKTDGKFFMHIFVHRRVPYLFEIKDDDDWMSRHFFSGGMMPSDDLPLAVQSPLIFVQRWRWDGTHYQKTANAWLANMQANRRTLWPLLTQIYGPGNARKWWMRWRVFFMACSELFGHRNGEEWWVSHYLFEKKSMRS